MVVFNASHEVPVNTGVKTKKKEVLDTFLDTMKSQDSV